jgi:hypothetical protein
MNQKQRVFNMLAKTSKTQMSKSRKVNFAIADDINEAFQDARVRGGEIMRSIDDAFNTVADLIAQIPAPDAFQEDLEMLAARLEEVLNNAENAAEQLGVDPNDIRGYSDAKDLLDNDIPNNMITLDMYRKEIEPILKAGGF